MRTITTILFAIIANVIFAQNIDYFTSKDLAFFGLHGHVKTLKEGYTTYTFDKNGTLILVDGKNPFKKTMATGDDWFYMKRNKYGYISDTYSVGGSRHYDWKNGKITKVQIMFEGGDAAEYSCYTDKLGLLKSYTFLKYMDGTEPCEKKVTFSYTKFDKNGNWTKRTKTNTGTEYFLWSIANERVITYHK